MSTYPTGDNRQQITKNEERLKQNKAELEKVNKRIEVVEKDLETATREGREVGDYPFWVSIQGKQHVLDTLKDERFNLVWSNDLLESSVRGLKERLIRVSEYRNWVKKNKLELEITEREIEQVSDEIQRLKAVDNANQVRLSELTEEEITIGTEVEGIEWDHWSNYNLIQGNRQIKANLIEKAKKIKERLREEGELDEEEE